MSIIADQGCYQVTSSTSTQGTWFRCIGPYINGSGNEVSSRSVAAMEAHVRSTAILLENRARDLRALADQLALVEHV